MIVYCLFLINRLSLTMGKEGGCVPSKKAPPIEDYQTTNTNTGGIKKLIAFYSCIDPKVTSGSWVWSTTSIKGFVFFDYVIMCNQCNYIKLWTLCVFYFYLKKFVVVMTLLLVRLSWLLSWRFDYNASLRNNLEYKYSSPLYQSFVFSLSHHLK